MTSCGAAFRRRRKEPVALGVLGWLRVLLLSMLVATPGMARAAMVDCPTMAVALTAVESEPPCHSMSEQSAAEIEVVVDPASHDAAPIDCCGSACAPALAVLADRIDATMLPATATPGGMPVASLASIASLPEKPPPRN